MNIHTELKIFPITVPIMGGNAQTIFRSAPAEVLSPPMPLHPDVPAHYSETHIGEVVRDIRHSRFGTHEWFFLAKEAAELSLAPAFDRWMCLDHCRELWERAGVVLYPHQLRSMERVIREMGGRAILADEVGLGKTIEAGMILKEYLLRGLVRRALILVPASLCWQWYNELKEKFGVLAGLQSTEHDWERSNLLIASIDTAKREPHRARLLDQEYDMLIVDEAHKLKNRTTLNWQLINGVRKKFFLLLTATPVQNDLSELYNLITLLRPGQLGTLRAFQSNFMLDKRTPKDPHRLHQLLDQVMIRNRRSTGTIAFTKRLVHPIPVELNAEERQLYEAVTSFVRGEYRRPGSTSGRAASGGMRSLLPLLTLQREVCSSPYAVAVSLDKMMQHTANPVLLAGLKHLFDLAVSIPNPAKLGIVENLIYRLQEQVIVFTEYRATQQLLLSRLQQAGINALGFDGSLSSGQKEWVRTLFMRAGQVLVSTESGGEGLNFQFCHNVINYDLPWNPMRLEQRIGRVHRLGQTEDVHIFNLATIGTIEEYILFLLHEKIDMFQMVIGELDAILTRLKLEKSLEGKILEILLDSHDPSDLKRRFEELGDVLAGQREHVRKAEEIVVLW